jgi:hypothetical protein
VTRDLQEHDPNCFAMSHELDQARADLAAAIEERDRLRGYLDNEMAQRAACLVENDRLRAVLATTRETVEALVQSVGERYITEAAVCTILAALRARAGLEATP